MKVDIVIPLYNEGEILAGSVGKLVDFLDRTSFPHDYTITLADNCSIDDSADVCKELANKYRQVRYLRIDKKGKGLAIRTAWSKSAGDVVAFMDADLSSDLESFPLLISLVAEGKSHLAIGNRLGPKSEVISKREMRKFASWFYNLTVRTLLKTTFDDHQCGFKAMKASAFKAVAPLLEEDGFFFDTELIVVSLRQGLTIESVDIVWRDSADSKVSLFRDSLKMFADMIRLRRRLAARPI